MIDFFSVSLDRAFLMSEGERQQVLSFSNTLRKLIKTMYIYFKFRAEGTELSVS